MASRKSSRLCVQCGQTKLGFFKTPEDEVPFVCTSCRCADCDIVIGIKCSCGVIHGKRSRGQQICTHCVEVREIVSTLDPALFKVRKEDQEKEEPIYR